MVRTAVVAILVTAALLPVSAGADNVNIGIGVNIGTPPPPPPPMVVAAPPQIIAVPNSGVSYAPNVGFNLFVYKSRYYSLHDGAWFFASTHHGPWTFVAVEKVPQPVLAVPVAYYKIPPGHAKKLVGPGAGGPGKGPKPKKWKDD